MAEVEKVKAWLTSIGVGHLVPAFLEKDLNTIQKCSAISDNELDALNITSPGVR
jgi:hypothetical protein